MFLALLAAVASFAMLLAGAYITGDGNREGPAVVVGAAVALVCTIAAVLVEA